MTYIHFAGIDVSKNWFDAALHGAREKPQRFDNTAAGHAAFLAGLGEDASRTFLVLEATGGYETALLGALIAAGVKTHRAAPWLSRSFARSLGRQAKTDSLDAKALARLAAERHETLRPFVPAPAEQAQLAELAMRRADLVAMRAAEKNRAAHPRYTQAAAAVAASLADSLRFLDAQIARLDSEIEALVQACESLRGRIAVMAGQTGIADTSAKILQAHLPELGSLSRRAAASLAGCAPHPRDTGLTTRKRTVFGGRSAVKRILFTAAMSARRHDPVMRAFFERLVQNGKPKMVALVAIMRKIVVQLNAKLRPHALAHHGR